MIIYPQIIFCFVNEGILDNFMLSTLWEQFWGWPSPKCLNVDLCYANIAKVAVLTPTVW